MKPVETCDVEIKRSLEQHIFGSSDSVSQLKMIIEAVRKHGKEKVLGYLDDCYRGGVFDYLSCFDDVIEQEIPKDVFFSAFWVFRDYLEVCSRQSVGLVIDTAEKCGKFAGKDLSGGLALEKIEEYLSRYPEDIDAAIKHCEDTAPYSKGSQFVWTAALTKNRNLYWGNFLSWVDNANNDDEITTTMRTMELIPEKISDVAAVADDVIARMVKINGTCLGDEGKGLLYRAIEAWRKVGDRQHQDALEGIANLLLREGSPFVLYWATLEAWRTTKQQSEECVDTWLSAFGKIDSQYKGIIDNLAYYLQELLDVCPEKVFSFIENYSREHSCNITVFNDIIGKIANCNETLLNRYCTRWLASDSNSVARNVYEIVSHVRPDKTLRINAVFDSCKESTDEILLLIFYRAIGWLYLVPETCVGFLISCACKMHKIEFLKSAYNDFYYLVVLNYIDEYKQELNKIPTCDRHTPNYKYLRKLASDADRWWKRFKSAGECPELYPSIRHKELYSKQQAEVYGKAMKEAHDNSILSQIAHNIYLLHGRGWIVPTQTGEGERMEESLLKRFSASVRIPRLAAIEGHTLETRLAELRRVRLEEHS